MCDVPNVCAFEVVGICRDYYKHCLLRILIQNNKLLLPYVQTFTSTKNLPRFTFALSDFTAEEKDNSENFCSGVWYSLIPF